jgi:hypothetical protein
MTDAAFDERRRKFIGSSGLTAGTETLDRANPWYSPDGPLA